MTYTDRLGTVCAKCGKDVYIETSLYSDWEGTVTCPKCRDTIERWQSDEPIQYDTFDNIFQGSTK